jgi:hypothetical protein
MKVRVNARRKLERLASENEYQWINDRIERKWAEIQTQEKQNVTA